MRDAEASDDDVAAGVLPADAHVEARWQALRTLRA
jgi:hypothetical protein